ncbi:MAG: hypothetical protein V3W02_05190, partial [Gammaproteobacteria bacterium]
NNFNTGFIEGDGAWKQLSDELATIIRSNSKLSPPKTAEQIRDASLPKARALATEIAGDEDRAEEIMVNLSRHFEDNIEDLPVQMDVLRVMAESTRNEMNHLAGIVLAGGSDIEMARFVRIRSRYIHFQDIRDGFAASLGRGLRSLGEKVGSIPIPRAGDAVEPSAKAAKSARDIVDKVGGAEAVRGMANDIHGQNAKGLEAVMQSMGKGSRVLRMVQEYWLNSILSGMITHTVNNVSNGLIAVWRPAEMWVDGFIARKPEVMGEAIYNYRKLVSGFVAAFRVNSHGLREVMGSVGEQLRGKPAALERSKLRMSALGDDVGSAWKAFVTNDSQFVQGARQFDFDEANAITASNVRKLFKSNIKSLAPGTFGARMVDGLGEGIRMSSRFLNAGDDAAKSINYHMSLNGLAYRRAVAAGVDDVDEFVQNLVQEVPHWRTNPRLTREQKQMFEEMDSLAQAEARRNTFTEPLAAGSYGKSMQDMVVKHPTLRFAVPFVRTPINLVKFVGERTPGIAGVTKRYKDAVKAATDLSTGKRTMTPELHAAYTRMMIGTGLYLVAGTAAYKGHLTGNGPANSAERAAMLATGWQPNSIRIDNGDGTHEYISFNRTDPFGLFLGIAGTLGETMGMMGDGDLDELGVAAVVALAETLQSKSYFTGLTDLISALDQPDRRLKRVAQKYIGSFVPNVLAQQHQQGAFGDDLMRETKSYGDLTLLQELDSYLNVLRARMPGLSADLPPRRNIFGEVITYAHGLGPDTISPFFTRTSADSLVNKEITRLSQQEGFGSSMNVFNTIGEVELDAHQRDRFIQLATGDPSRNGSDLRDGLTKMMKTRKYRNADDSKFGKQKLIRDYIGKRRKRGRREMLKRDSALNLEVRDAKRKRREAVRVENAKKAEGPQASAGTSVVDQFTTSLGRTPRNLT